MKGFLKWIETVRQAAEGFHWHNGQCCQERVLLCRNTMSGRVDWYNPITHVYREGGKR